MTRSALVSIAVLVVVVGAVTGVRSARQEAPGRAVTTSLMAHSFLYGGYEDGGPKLGEGYDTRLIQGTPVMPTPVSISEYATQRACRADSILTGRVTDSASALTAGGHFIFTDYDVLVDDVVKQHPDANLLVQDHVIVTRPGGHVQIGTQRLQAFHDGFPLLDVGSFYLLFLHFLPDTQSYQSVDIEGAFELNDQHAHYIGKFPIAIDSTVDRGSFLATVRNLAFVPCS